MDGRDRDAFVAGGVLGIEGTRGVQADPRDALPTARRGHVDALLGRSRGVPSGPPRCDDSGPRPARTREPPPTDGPQAAAPGAPRRRPRDERDATAPRRPLLHRPRPEPQRAQLRQRHHPPLPISQLRQRAIEGWPVLRTMRFAYPGHPPSLPGNSRQRTPQTQRFCVSAGTAHSPDIVDRVPSEADILAVGRDLAAALPGASRNPLKAIDDKAMDLASQDAELRAALFRFVDVVPACRSLDDLARHLTGFLDEVDDRPPPLQVAMRMSESRAGRAGARRRRRGRRQAHGPPLHRRRDAARGHRRARGPVEARRRHERRPARRGDGHRAPRPTATPRAAARRSTGSSRSTASCPTRPRSRPTAPGAIPRANLSVKVSALTPLLRPDAPELGKRDAAVAPARPPAPRRASSTPTCTSTWSPSTRARRSPTSCSSCSPRTSSATARRAGLVLQAYLRDSPELCERIVAWAQATPRGYPLLVRLVKGAYWDHEIVEARQHGWESPVFEVKADSDRNFEALTRRLLEARPAVRVAIASHNLRSIAHAVAANRAMGGDDGDVELQVLAASATTSRRRWPSAACACAPTARSATSSPAWPTSSAGCSRTRATSRFLARAGRRPLARRAARRAMTDLPTFVNEPIGELRRAPRARRAHRGHGARSSASCPLRVPVWIGDGRSATATS